MNPLLHAREVRSNHINGLLESYPTNTIVILKTNVVGDNKNPQMVGFLLAFFNQKIQREFTSSLIHTGKQQSMDGNYYFYVIKHSEYNVKERCIHLEEFDQIGRLMDIDVYNEKANNTSISNKRMRKCLLCEEPAFVCARNKTHSEERIMNKMRKIITTFLQQYLSDIAIESIYDELQLYPKFGLVSSHDNGCHTDMDYALFTTSTSIITPYITAFIAAGLKNRIDASTLVHIGQNAEHDMFLATRGVNTQKGLIFLLGLFLPAVANAIFYQKTETSIVQTVQELSAEIIGDYYEQLCTQTAITYGDKLYLQYGLKGPRGEALQGFKRIFDMPEYDELTTDDRHHQYLIHMMRDLGDTTLIHKTSLATLKQLQQEMNELLTQGGYPNNKEHFMQLSEMYKKRNVSPGGAADMIVLQIIYEKVKHLLLSKKEEHNEISSL